MERHFLILSIGVTPMLTGCDNGVGLEKQVRQACAELARRLYAGEPVRAEHSFSAFPVLAADADSALELIYSTEFVIRAELGQQPSFDEYYERFPQWRERLEHQFQFHELLGQREEAGRSTIVMHASPDGSGAKPERFELLREIGHSGMGIVYQGRQVRLNRLVALKLIAVDERTEPEDLMRFQRGAENQARLQHPNIIQVYAVGESDGRPCFVMEFGEGGSLAQKIAGQPQPAEEAARCLKTLAEAMHYAHEQGIVHRDLKPANVVVSADGQPKITDFGLAKRLGEEAGQTRSGAILGTPSYMAPEQAAGKTKEVGPLSDVYALGAILYEALTGRPPFQADTVLEVLQQVQHVEPIAPRRHNPSIARAVETICLKCLRKKPARRYPSAAALAEDLGRFLRREAIQARPVSRLERLGQWGWRNPAWATAGALAAALLVTGIVVPTQFAVREHENSQTLAKTLREAEYQLAVNEMDQGLYLLEEGRDSGLGMLKLSASLRKAPADAHDLHRVIRSNLASWFGQVASLRESLVHQGEVLAVAFSPDAKTVLTGSADNCARLWDAATGKQLGRDLSHDGRDGRVCTVAFHPNSSMILTGSSDGTARVWETGTGKALGPPIQLGDAVCAVAFAADGKAFLTATRTKGVQLWDTETGKPLGQPMHPKGFTVAMAFDPDGRTALTGSQDGIVQAWDLKSGKSIAHALKHPLGVHAMAFSPKGRTILTGSLDRDARLWDVNTGQVVSLHHPASVQAVAFSPDGQTVLTSSADNCARLWDATTGACLLTLPHPGRVNAVGFSPDGGTVLTGSADNYARLWGTAPANMRPTRFRHDSQVRALAFSTDGSRILTGSFDCTASLWDASTGNKLADFVGHKRAIMSVALSPDGNTVLTGSYDKTACLWEASGNLRACLGDHQGTVWAVAFSPNGEIALTASSDGTARLWSVKTGEPLGKLPHQGLVQAIAISPDGQTVLTGSHDGTAQLWGLKDQKRIGAPFRHDAAVSAVAFSPKGQFILTGSATKTAQLWQVATGERFGPPLPLQEEVRIVAFCKDGNTVLTAGRDKIARLWETSSGKPCGRPLRHQAAIQAAVFSPDGKTVLTGSEDQTARRWDAATGRQLGPPLPQRATVEAVAYSPDGSKILIGCDKGDAYLYEVPTPVEGEVERIVLWTQVLTGMELDDGGGLHVLDGRTWKQRLENLRDHGSPPLR